MSLLAHEVRDLVSSKSASTGSLSPATADRNLRTGDTLDCARTGDVLNSRRVDCVNPRRIGGVNSWRVGCDKGGVGCNNSDDRASTSVRGFEVRVLESGEVRCCALLPSRETSPVIRCTKFWGFADCGLNGVGFTTISSDVEKICTEVSGDDDRDLVRSHILFPRI